MHATTLYRDRPQDGVTLKLHIADSQKILRCEPCVILEGAKRPKDLQGSPLKDDNCEWSISSFSCYKVLRCGTSKCAVPYGALSLQMSFLSEAKNLFANSPFEDNRGA